MAMLLRFIILSSALFGMNGIAASRHTTFLNAANLHFQLQSNLEPFESFACEHSNSPVGLFEWDIRCPQSNTVRKFSVHLVVSFYPRTQYGVGSYEILYWVTDWASTTRPVSDSSTIWIHNDHKENRAQVIEVGQGVENDLANLRIKIDLRTTRKHE